ncbi:hypothetical protein O9992_05180 [Vibrio lentus]|nr:hypothetical protein [Vibrio lentus]
MQRWLTCSRTTRSYKTTATANTFVGLRFSSRAGSSIAVEPQQEISSACGSTPTKTCTKHNTIELEERIYIAKPRPPSDGLRLELLGQVKCLDSLLCMDEFRYGLTLVPFKQAIAMRGT